MTYTVYMDELKWFIVVLVVLWMLWVATGGYSRIENGDKPFLEQPSPIEGGKPYTLDELKRRTAPY